MIPKIEDGNNFGVSIQVRHITRTVYLSSTLGILHHYSSLVPGSPFTSVKNKNGGLL